ncbi:MAG TPA: ankyrin repeat domain-containing protein [Thermoanaerobaculia bacterium]
MNLFEAIRQGDVARVAALLDEDPSLLAARDGNVSAILLAVYHGRADIARLFVERGARLSFAEAVALGDTGRVRELLRETPALLHERTPDGFASAAFAIFFGHHELAKWLIEEGADVNAASENAQRVAPVHAAAAVCDRAIMRILLDRGADPNARQQLEYTPLHGAASRGDVEMAELLLSRGADANVRGSDGLTPADLARKYGKEEFAQWFEQRVT